MSATTPAESRSEAALDLSRFSWKEMMAVFLARQITDTDRITSGAHTEISFAACMLAQKTHAPNLKLQLGGTGFLCNVADVEVDELPRTSVDYRILGWAEGWFDHPDTFIQYGPPGYRRYYEHPEQYADCNKFFFADKFFVGGLQVDAHGNVNLIGLGSGGRFTVRGPGTVGINDVTSVRDVFVFMTVHDRQRLVPAVDYISMPGPRAIREHRFLGHGPQWIVTPRCVFDFSGPDDTAALAGVFPGHTEEEVAEHTGWDVVRSPEFTELEPPSALELGVLRGEIDRKGVLRS